jgi:type VI secretion system secreted protein Hcp
MKKFLLCIGLSASALLAHTPASATLFLMIDGINGESTYKTSSGWIEISSFQFGIANPSSIGSSTGGAGAGKVSFSDLTVTKQTDKSSPSLFLDAASGTHLKNALLDVVNNGGNQTLFLEYKLTDVLISGYSISSGGDRPTESLSLKFGKLQFTEFPQNANGSLGTPITVDWDLALNTGTGPAGAVPEPATLAMLAAGLGVLGLQVARRRKT